LSLAGGVDGIDDPSPERGNSAVTRLPGARHRPGAVSEACGGGKLAAAAASCSSRPPIQRGCPGLLVGVALAASDACRG